MSNQVFKTVTTTLVMFAAQTTAQATPSVAAAMRQPGGATDMQDQPPTNIEKQGQMSPVGPIGPWNTSDPFPDKDFPPLMLDFGQLAGLEFALLAVTLILLCIRIYFRVYMTKTLKWSDGFAICSWVSFAIWVSIETRYLTNGSDEDFFTLPNSVKLETMQMGYIQPIFYFLTVYAIKGAMLCFYHELITRTTRQSLRITLYVIGAFSAIGFLFTNLYGLFGCMPISANWSLDPAVQCTTHPSDASFNRVVFVEFFWHLFTDLAIYIFPVFILRGMVLPKRKKIDAGIMFAIGFLTLVNASFYFALSWINMPDPSSMLLAQVWEMAFAVSLACAPSLKVFWLQKVEPGIRRVTDSFRSLASRSSARRRGATNSGDELNELEKQQQSSSSRHLRIHRKRNLSVSEIRLVTLEEHVRARDTRMIGQGGVPV